MAKRKKDTENVANSAPAEAPAKPKRVAKPKNAAEPKAAKAATPAVASAEAPESSSRMAASAAPSEPAWPGPAVEPSGGPNGVVSRERIASRAYEIFQSRGGVHGDPLQDWLEAERQLKGRR